MFSPFNSLNVRIVAQMRQVKTILHDTTPERTVIPQHDVNIHHMLKAGYKFVCLEKVYEESFVRFASLRYHSGKWHPSSTINFEYRKCDQPNDPSMAIQNAQPSAQMVIEDSQSPEWGFDKDTAEALLAETPTKPHRCLSTAKFGLLNSNITRKEFRFR
jgi:hypothetical protein